MSEITRKLATVRRITALTPIPDADRIQLATVDGWGVVVQTGLYEVGDLACYFEIDSWLPTTIAPFLTKDGHFPKTYDGVEGERLKTVRLRKTLSQGLLIPLTYSDEPEGRVPMLVTDTIACSVQEGDDLTEMLGIKKWEAPISAQLAGMAKGNFPSYCRKTDQERIENFVKEVFTNSDDSLFEVTLKLDGSSCSVYHNNGVVGVCSRNLDLKIEENTENTFVATATKTNLLTVLATYGKNIQVSGELCGPGIQGNKENLSSHQLFVFDIFDIDTQKYLSPTDRASVFADLVSLGFTGAHVPVITSGVKLCDIGITDVASSKKYVDRPSLSSDIAEGCVFKRMDGEFSFKSINNRWLLQFE